MAPKRKKQLGNPYEDLYVCMQDVTDKRKSILLGIKNSLIMQEEYEKLMEIRKTKSLVTQEIKKCLEQINIKYQEFKKQFPNVKNIITYTEKELTELESQINKLKVDNKYNSENIVLEEDMKEKIETLNKGIKSLGTTVKVPSAKQESPQKEAVKHADTHHEQKSLSKLDRIKNNLRVIESKLKNI